MKTPGKHIGILNTGMKNFNTHFIKLVVMNNGSSKLITVNAMN